MIIDIPCREDFQSAGKDFLCLAWETLFGLSHDLEDCLDQTLEDDLQITDAYWTAAQRPLSTALSLTEQAVEFLLKGEIAATSPFLLIANDFNGWPKPQSSNQVRFSEFKTIDAKDLIRVYNTISTNPLNIEFKQLFENLRTKRNTIMHTIDPSLRIRTNDVIANILEIHHNLIPNETWIDIRRNHLYTSPTSIAYLYSDEQFGATLIREIESAIILLEPNLVKKYFKINKKQRRYICPDCYCMYVDFLPGGFPLTALLKPNSSISKKLHCFICDTVFDVERKDCPHANCQGNVIHANDGTCLTCFGDT
jgi:hypothetical protein